MSWPPYHLMERDYLAVAQQKYARLERLYHVGARNAWDGKQLLGDLVRKHGGIQLADDKKRALAEIFTTILWGELAAWSISADLALQLDDTEAKMAATSQVFDEARHFYTLRDYLLALDVPLPPLDGYTHTVLTELLDTDRLVDKLLGMQLIVESIAVTLFRSVAQAGVEPVLSELMPYFERDEARHVGLGVLYLPKLLAQLGPIEATRPQAAAAQGGHPGRLRHAPQEGALRDARHRQQRELPPRLSPQPRRARRHALRRRRDAAGRARGRPAARRRQRLGDRSLLPAAGRACAGVAADAGGRDGFAQPRRRTRAQVGGVKTMRELYTSLVTGVMFVLRMLLLGLMTLLQLTLGGAEIRPASREASS